MNLRTYEPMPRRTQIDWKWLTIGALLIVGAVAWTVLSSSFVYGEGHEDRPILQFLLAYGVVWSAFAVAVLLLVRGSIPPVWWILVVAILARAALFPSLLIQENDVYRYVLDGNVLMRGENPFEYAPLVLPGYARGELAADLQTSEARIVLDRVGFPWIPTIYPPVAQLAFAAGALIGGWDWLGQRAVFVAIEVLVVLLLLILLALQGRPLAWVLLYTWNPLPLKEIVNSAHFDILVALFVLLLVFSLRRYADGKSLFAAAAGLALGLAVLTKLYPCILIPACLLAIRRDWKGFALFLGAFSACCLLGFLPFAGVGWESLTAGLSAYAEGWRMNEGVFSLVDIASGQPRLATALILAVLALLLPLSMERQGKGPEAVCFWMLLIWFLLIPTPYPWYSVPVMALAVIYPLSSGVVAVMSGALGLYYLSFFFEYRGMPEVWWAWTKIIEHASIWLSIVWVWRFRDQVRRLISN